MNVLNVLFLMENGLNQQCNHLLLYLVRIKKQLEHAKGAVEIWPSLEWYSSVVESRHCLFLSFLKALGLCLTVLE